MKKKILKLVAGIMAAVFLVGTIMSDSVLAAESCNYLALGDSITEGNQSYVSQVGDYLRKQNGTCTVANLGISGCKSTDLADALTNSSNPYYTYVTNYVKNADVITLDIGSNDILITAYEIVADCFGCEMEELNSVLAAWSNKLQSSNWFVKIIAYYQAQSIARAIKRELNNGTRMEEAVEEFKTSYDKIIKCLQQKAPNADIYIGNLYNPYHGAPSMYLGSSEVINFETFTEKYVSLLNRYISQNSGSYQIVDLYNVITSDAYLIGDFSVYDYNPHPNEAGHKAIANAFIKAMR